MAFDSKDGYVVMFGGWDCQLGYLNDTWKFAAGKWSQITASVAPSPRAFASMTYDAKDGYVVLFGGARGYGYRAPALADTWKFDGGTWTNITPAVSPHGRYSAAMTYDAADGYVLLFGGYNGSWYNNPRGDTWSYSAGVWSRVHGTVTPPLRGAFNLAYDRADGYVVMFGGTTFPDTWKFSAGTWTNITHGSRPAPRFFAVMAYDYRLAAIVLFGGLGKESRSNTWEFSGGTWSKFVETVWPGSVYFDYPPAMAYDRADGYELFFGGMGFINVITTGCPGSHLTWTFQ